MNCSEIIQKYLKENGFDGLYSPDECACIIGDLVPCCNSPMECQPGYKIPCGCGEGHDFDIGKKKGKEKNET
uniref:Uncharacterized protein n=1 Tax=viral metagenome TaxID=1070528 RepID=A0A6M3JQ24_9ZZZZ